MLNQTKLRFSTTGRGTYNITEQITDAINKSNIKAGICHIFIQHTSASLTINENADPTVRVDFESHLNVIVPENAPYYIHNYEGPDDMPAHIKSSLMGASVQIPITNGRLNLGIWQGIYLCEHRNHTTGRKLVLTCFGGVK